MSDKKIQRDQARSSEHVQKPAETTAAEVTKRAHEVYFLGIREIQRAHSSPPSTARIAEHAYTVARSGEGPAKG